jgi:hypothetical protein
MVCRDFILPEPASYVSFYAFFNLRKLLYIIGKGTGPSNLPKPILASFCHASKNGRKKARKSLKLLGFSQRHLFWCSLMKNDPVLNKECTH